MKRNTISAMLWAAAGLILAAVTLCTAIYGTRSTPKVRMDQEVFLSTVDRAMIHICTDNYTGLSQLLYGNPDLGQIPAEDTDAQSMIWRAYLDSIRWTLPESCTPTSSGGLSVDVSVQCMDIPAVTAALEAIVPEQVIRLAEGKSKDEIYEQNKNHLPEFQAEVLRAATEEVLSQPIPELDRTLTLELIRSEGSWKILPTEELMHFLSGFVAE